MVRMSGWRVVGISLTLHNYDGSTAGGDKTNWMGFTDREARLA